MKLAAHFASAALVAGLAALPQPAAAQESTGQRIAEIIVFGTDPCPRSTDDEIVVCRRVDEAYRYRMPESYRQSGTFQERQAWANKARTIERVGRTGIQSCSPVCPSGYTGCMDQIFSQARREADQARAEQTAPEQ